MIKADGIWAFHGSMTFAPPNPKFRKELKGDFVHKFYDRDGNLCRGLNDGDDVHGYWYDGWSSYPDECCVDIREEPSAAELIAELEQRIAGLKDLVVTGENLPEVQRIIDNVSEWVSGVKAATL